MQADYVIVGSGSAGSALAYRLGEAGHSVAVIEYGGTDWGPFIQMPAALSYPMNMARYDWGFRTEPEPHLGGRTLATPRGKVLGGSSSINGMVYVRGHPRDFDTWAEMGADGWAWADVAPYFKRMESWHGGHSDWRGYGRPAARHPRPAPQPALPQLRRGRRPGRLRAHLRLQRRRSRRASARWSRPSGAAAAGPPPTPTCARRSPAATSRSSRGLAARVVIAQGRATGVEVVRPARPRDHRRPPRGHPLRLLDQHPEAPDALRHRPGRPPRRARHRRSSPTAPASAPTCRTTSSSTSRCGA